MYGLKAVSSEFLPKQDFSSLFFVRGQISLTKQHVLNLYDLLTQLFIFPYRGWSLACAWYFNWRQILFGQRYSLWIPVPSLATHMVATLLAPYVDWKQEFRRIGGTAGEAAASTPAGV